MSIYHDSFSCKIAFVARAFRGAGVLPLDPLVSGVLGIGRTTSESSLTTSNVRGFSKWKFSSK